MEIIEQETSSTTTEKTQKVQLESKSLTKIFREFIVDGKLTFIPSEENNNFKVFIYFALMALGVLNFTVTQILIHKSAQPSLLQRVIQYFSDESTLFWITFFGLIVLKILLVVSVVMELILKKKILIISWLNKKCINNYTILKQLDLSISGMMVLVSQHEYLAQLIISAVITIFHAIYLQQYINRREPLYVSSSIHYILFQVYLTFNYLANATFLNLDSKSYFGCYSVFAFILLLSWYHLFGYELYIHKLSKLAHLGVISLLLTFYMGQAENWILNKSFIDIDQTAKIIITFAIMIFLNNLTKSSFDKIIGAQSVQEHNTKYKDMHLMRLLHESASDRDKQSLLLGILYLYYSRKYDLHIDYFANGKIFDSYLKESVPQSAIYIKDIYEKSIEIEKEENADNLLNYCQFLVNEFNNLYLTLEIIKKIKKLSLNIVQLVKVAKIEFLLKEQHDRLNQQLYGGKLEMEHIFEAEQCLSLIESKLYQYIQGNMEVWSSLQLQEIEMGELRNALKREMNTIEEINCLWKVISKFFKINKAWRFIYMHYVMFIKNQKIKQKELDFFTTPKKQSIFEQQILYFENQTPQVKFYDQNVMFNLNSCCFLAAYEHEQIYIRDANSRFSKMLGYTKEEINGANLSLIMPPDLRQDHRNKLKEWVNSGYISNEMSYRPRITSFITKHNQQIPAVKYYKAIYQIKRGLEYVCLLKSNGKPKIVDFEDRHQTKSLSYLKSRQVQEKETNVKQLWEQFEENLQFDSSLKINIFLKQDILQPKKTISDINHFKIAARAFSLLMITAIVALALNNVIQSQTIDIYSNQFSNFFNVYRLPILLNTNYMKQFLNIGNVTKANSVIASATDQFLQISSKQITEKTLFDRKLNHPNTYYPYYNYSLPNRENLSSIDLFYSILSSVSSLNSKNINRTSYQYQFFNSYLKPSYDEMMNMTKNQLHKTFDQIFSSTIMQQVWFVSAQSIVLVLFIFVLFKLIHAFITKMRNIIFILLDFHPNHVLITYRYWKSVNKSFRKLFLQVHQHNRSSWLLRTGNQSKKIDKQSKMTQNHTSMNKKTKKMKEDVNRKRLEVKLRVLLVIVMLLILTVTVSIQLSVIATLQELRTFEKDGFFFLKYFPVASIVAMGCIEKSYSDQFQIPSQQCLFSATAMTISERLQTRLLFTTQSKRTIFLAVLASTTLQQQVDLEQLLKDAFRFAMGPSNKEFPATFVTDRDLVIAASTTKHYQQMHKQMSSLSQEQSSLPMRRMHSQPGQVNLRKRQQISKIKICITACQLFVYFWLSIFSSKSVV